MTRFRRLWFLPLALLLAQTAPAARVETSIGEQGKAALSGFLSTAVRNGDVPGVVALVVDGDRVIYEGAAGQMDVAHRVDMRTDSIFRIASMTKPVTTVAALMLVEAGKLQLDDPVSKYLPGFDRPVVLSKYSAADGAFETRPAKRPMTIRHLMTHTSGLGYGWSSPIVARLTDNTRARETEIPLLNDPGDEWHYSASTRVLGQVVEKVAGVPLDDFFRSRIFGPLAISETGFAVPPEKVSRVVTVHQRTGGTLVEQPNAEVQQSPVSGEGGLYSTARDYGTFMQMLLNGGRLGSTRVLGERFVAMMGKNQIGSVIVQEQPAADPLRTRPFPLGAGRDKFGFGFQIAAADPRYAKLRSPGSLSWAGIDNTHFWIDPKRHIAAVVMMQVLPFYDERCISVLRGFEELVYQHLTSAPS
jgi:methyl acetate hydrolase